MTHYTSESTAETTPALSLRAQIAAIVCPNDPDCTDAELLDELHAMNRHCEQHIRDCLGHLTKGFKAEPLPTESDLRAEITRLVSCRTADAMRMARLKGLIGWLWSQRGLEAEVFDRHKIDRGLEACEVVDDGRKIEVREK